MKSRSFRHLYLIMIAILLVAAFGVASPVYAATFNPITVSDLITAITTANSNSADDTINLSGNFILTAVNNGENGLPVILADSGHSLTIEGNGFSISRDGAAPNFRIFEVASGATLTLNALTIADGNTTTSIGGGIYNLGTLTITNSTVSGNSAITGGGIVNNGTLTITNSTFSGNSANTSGGINNDGTLTITNSTFSGNSAGNVGGIYNLDTLTITNSTFSGNSANAGGSVAGGIYNLGTLTITNSTFSGNSAISGGGIYRFIGEVTLRNTVVDNNPGGNCFGTITNGGNNLDSGATCGWASTDGSMSNTNPQLGLLANNGGPTQTMALLAGSPAIDGVTFNAPNSAPGTDQRGLARPQGALNDIGAFELDVLEVPAVSLSAVSLNYGNQPVGVASAPQTITVTNTGDGDLHIGTLGITGEFGLSNNTCNGATVIPAGTCTFEVTFSPASIGAKVGQVSIPSDAATSPDTVSLSGTGVVGLTATFTSLGAHDGHVREKSETAEYGGSSSASGGFLQIGDSNADRQVKGFLAFDTSTLPDGAVVTAVRIEMYLMGAAGTNPFLTHGGLNVDIANPSFDALTLAPGDFQAAPTAYDVAVCETALATGWFGCDLVSYLGDLNLTGTTQFRLWFDLPDNDDLRPDYLKIASGNRPKAIYRPVLIVEYYVP